jgi:diguanylate cyclase (GGDEF)-like protein/PAS domain S-box-containing protein
MTPLSKLLLVFIGVALSFPSFGDAPPRPAAKPLEAVSLQLKWFHQFQFAGYYAAKAQGFYAEEGLEVEIRARDPAKEVVKQVLAGEADFAIGDSSIIAEYANGQPIIALAAIFQHDPLAFISKQSSGVIGPYEMKGKRIMFDDSGGNEAPLRALLAFAELTAKDYRYVPHTFSNEDLLQDKVDVMSAYLNDQPFYFQQRGVALNIINPQNYGIDFYGDILFTSQRELNAHPGRAERFRRASLKGWKYALAHPEEIIQLIQSQYHSPLSLEHLRFEARESDKHILPGSIPIGQISPARLRRTAEIYANLKLAKPLSDGQLQKFVYGAANPLKLSETEQAWLAKHPVIRLGIDRNFAPYEWIDEKGAYQGLAADFMRLLEKRLGARFEIVKDKTWQETLDMAKRGEIDMIGAAVKTEAREHYLFFSPPYVSNPAIIINDDRHGYIGSLERLAGKRVAVEQGYFVQELLAQEYPAIQLVPAASVQDALRKVFQGQADAYVGDAASASYAIKEESLLSLRFSGQTPYQSQSSVAVTKFNPELASIVDKALASISQQESDDIINHWMGLKIEQGIKIQDLLKYAVMLGVLFILFGYWIYRLRREVRAKYLAESELRAILETEPECVKVTDAKGRLLRMNHAGLVMIEADSEPHKVFGQAVDALVVKEDRAAFNAMNQRVLAGETCGLEFQIRGLKGALRYMETHAVPLRDAASGEVCVLAVTRDITERKRADIALRNSEKKLNDILDNISAYVYLKDLEGRYLYANRMVCDLWGVTLDAIIGATDDKFFDAETAASLRANDRRVLVEGETVKSEETNTVDSTGRAMTFWSVKLPLRREDGSIYALLGVSTDITEKKQADALIWSQANLDPLTQLPNRRLFTDRLAQEVKRARRENALLGLLFLDLDRFKEVNDTLGHSMGDLLLIEAARRIRDCVREADTVARLGGDEFTLILSKLTHVGDIERVAQDLIDALSYPFQLGEEQAFVSASIGITIYPLDAGVPEALAKNADQAMYAAKRDGRNCYRYFTGAMQEEGLQRMRLIRDMHQALKADEFSVHYQPIVDLAQGSISKAEALLRWRHPQLGFISPALFVPIAEDTGMIHELGDWVFHEAARQVKRWQGLYGGNFQISVNKSPVQFQRAEYTHNHWLEHLSGLSLSGASIVVEITEGLLLKQNEDIAKTLLKFRDAGVQVALDDFGTGYSSLAYLNKFDIDYLKIDQSFTRRLAPGSSDLALSEAIVVMAHKLGLKVIAEGVETEAQCGLLREVGCDYGQGYLFSKPVPPALFEQMMNTRDSSWRP